MGRTIAFLYGAACYVAFLVAFLYAVGFIGGFMVPTSLDSPPAGPFGLALLVDLGLLALFAVQHSVMARPAFKRLLTRVVPEPIERSTYVLASSLALFLLFREWRPLGGMVWSIDSPAGRLTMQVLFGAGLLLVLVATFLINHFDLFGLRQVWLHLKGRAYRRLPFKTPGPYRLVRHPLYVGWLLTFWATPVMTMAHLVFAVMTTAYILVGIRLEERDLAVVHPEYADYRRRVPMLVPFGRRRTLAAPAGTRSGVAA
jgi:protein-S-isoprenylcysteine O-methyltransferase Ste14